jgi:hypothetical protein
MQNQQPGYPAVNYAETAVATRSRAPLFSLWRKVQIGGAIALGLFAAGVALVAYFKSQKNVVFFENSLEKAGELSLNGKSYGTLEPHQHVRLELDAESYSVSFNGGGAKLDEGTLTVPKASGGFGTMGFRAVYNIGGRKGLGVVTKYYGGSLKDNVRPIEEGKRLVELPNLELTKIDDAFPDSIKVQKGVSFGTVVRVCHIDEEKETVGCPGW